MVQHEQSRNRPLARAGNGLTSRVMKEHEQAQRLLDLAEAAEYLGVSPGQLRIWAKSGLIRHGRVGVRGDFRFRLTDLEEYAFRENPCFRGTPDQAHLAEELAS